MRIPDAALLCVGAILLVAGCQRGSPSGRLSAEQIAAFLPKGTTITEVAYADLNEDGREEAYITAKTAPEVHTTAAVLAPDRRGQIAVVFQRRLAGETWLPIQIGRSGDGAPMIAIFAAQGGGAANLSYVVVQYLRGVVQATLDQSELIGGRVRFIPDGLLETRGDIDRIYRWSESGWQAEELGSQYLPPLPPETTTVEYRIDPVRGPLIDGPRALRMRVGQHLILRRVDQGEPSRLFFAGGGSSLIFGADGVITLVRPDLVEINIEGPAYSGRTATISLRIDP